MTAADRLFFAFGAGTDAPALALLGGSLILDSGEAERTFLYRCQDRYLVLAGLLGLRCLFFVAGDDHVLQYRRQIAAVRAACERIGDACGALPEAGVPEPLFVCCDLDTLRVGACDAFTQQIRRPEFAAAAGGIYLNQISPTGAELLAQVECLLGADWGLSEVRRLGKLALRFHNKARCVELLADSSAVDPLPPHVPTAVIPARRFLALSDPAELAALYAEQTGDRSARGLFVKSAQDSGGNVSGRLDQWATLRQEVRAQLLSEQVDWAERLRALGAEIESCPTLRGAGLTEAQLLRWLHLQAEQRRCIDVLVQREVRTSPEASFPNLGLSCLIPPEGGDPVVFAVGAQIYRDAERRAYLGSFLSDALAASVLTPDLRSGLAALCRRFADQGYHGPICFDARRGPDGVYQFLYDCNPRLTAVFAALAVRHALRRAGLPCASVLSLGYRGEFVYPDLAATLARLERAELLYTASRPRGLLILPNLYREHGFDLVAVNLELAEVDALLRDGLFCENGTPPRRLYA